MGKECGKYRFKIVRNMSLTSWSLIVLVNLVGSEISIAI